MEPLAIIIFIFFWVISTMASSKNRQRSSPGGRGARPGRGGAGLPQAPQQPGWPVWGPEEDVPQAQSEASGQVPTPALVQAAAPPGPPAAEFTPAPRESAAPIGDGAVVEQPPFLTSLLEPESILTGIVFSEIIGRPKGRRSASFSHPRRVNRL